MTEPLKIEPAEAGIEVSIGEDHGWHHICDDPVRAWFKGHVKHWPTLLRGIEQFSSRPAIADLETFIASLDGHFALVVKGRGWALVAADRVRSIPVAFAQGPDDWIVDAQAERLRRHLRLGVNDVDHDAALALAMSGYTIDVATLFTDVEQLGPGEFVLLCPGEEAQRHRYYCYRPWRADKVDYEPAKLRKQLAEILLATVDEMMTGIGDRLLIVPLSAGRDSRLIVSAARHLGYDNIRTFAYGLRGNHEAEASCYIAGKLGYDWKFVPTSTRAMRRHYASDVWLEYCAYGDTLQSIPFVQDLPQLSELKEVGFVPDDAVLANGNSGDFISGAHIVPELCAVTQGHSSEERLARITSLLSGKHFSLWQSLRTPENCRRIEASLQHSIDRAGAVSDGSCCDFGVYEFAEFQDRQCKYVISGQRIYEFLGHEWRLPLWDKALLDFFEKLPLEGKVGQKLYADTLKQENWGGVWQDVPVNRRSIRPNWIRPLRVVAKVAHAPLGKPAWHAFEKRYFSYWMEPGAQSAIRNYGDVARDRRGARHGVAWLAEAYLGRHGLGHDGRVH